jgi:hypothetical protein
VGGVLGPPAFVAAWAGLGAGAARYDPTRDAISRLAALGAPTRPGMTAGLVALGAGMALYGLAVRPHPTWTLAVANGVTALAVAALPLGGAVDTAHGVSAALGYVTLTAIPVVASPRLPPRWARLSVAIGVASAGCLVASALADRAGLLQRLGLTMAHAWIVVSAVGLVRSPTSSSTTPPAGGPAGRRR